MLIDGEKYACEACVRGHRVSNCQHTNRPLQHINKKGRPVSQCAHCRSLRKSRAAHVKCDCGEKTSKCAHLQPTVEGHRETCCCNHGGRCTCSVKKENPLGTVPESDSDDARNMSGIAMAKAPVRRRRAVTVHSSDSRGLALEQHGHQRSSKQGSRAAQRYESYSLSRANSATGVSGLGLTSDALLLPARGHAAPACDTREQRQVKSETTSPLISSSSFSQLSNPSVPPLDLSNIDYPSCFNMFGSNGLPSDVDTPLFSAALSTTSVDWNAYDLGKTNGGSFTPSSYSQAGTQSFSGMFDLGSSSEQLPRLANPTSTSGEVSEVEDLLPTGEGDFDSFATGGGLYLRQGHATDLSGMDYSSFYKTEDSNACVGTISMVEEDPAFWLPNYNDGITTMDDASDSMAGSLVGFWDI
ncbi:Copper resistance protein CRF1 [Escovopsis weberi]|uniref:Copper resistance protein CRF1 n=1 Tax=Escovopsis weberi TaxID=150374 RepID=A0A0M8MZ92_ESCWE|nr:Copper resistance protein CRF1 [Escovopsis weberi]